jgi:hypothetical protein
MKKQKKLWLKQSNSWIVGIGILGAVMITMIVSLSGYLSSISITDSKPSTLPQPASDTVPLKIKVTDTEELPLEYVDVEVMSNISQSKRTNSNGYVEFPVSKKMAKVSITLLKDGYKARKVDDIKIAENGVKQYALKKIDITKPVKSSSTSPSPQGSVTPTSSSKTPSPTLPSPPSVSETPLPSLKPPYLISPTLVPSPSNPLSSPSSAEISELKRMDIDIFQLEGNKEMEHYAQKIQEQLVNRYGLIKNKITVKKRRKEVIQQYSCPWSNVQYDLEEENAARKLKDFVQEITPGMSWNLFLVNTHLPKTISHNKITIFLNNDSTFNEFYPISGQQIRKKKNCEIYKRS